jgi:hypothetical protein
VVQFLALKPYSVRGLGRVPGGGNQSVGIYGLLDDVVAARRAITHRSCRGRGAGVGGGVVLSLSSRVQSGGLSDGVDRIRP